ncbi:MAG: LamG domain-containing protein [Candidatus Terrybacteria bacterium]|nr:LamG domain-containing protein [Candidatus Terrybacteria bacterium]
MKKGREEHQWRGKHPDIDSGYAKSGQALAGQAIFPLVLVLTLVLGLIGVTFAGAGYIQSLLAGQRAFAEQARQAAASGVNDALIRIVRDRTWTNAGGYNVTSNGATATVTVQDSSTTTNRYRDEVLANTPTAYWRLGEPSGATAQDETVNNIDGTYSGATLGQAGALASDANTSVLFTAPGPQYVDIANFGTFTTMTVEAWVYRTGAVANRESIVSYKEGDPSNCGFVLGLNEDGVNQYPRIYVNVDGGWQFAERATAVPVSAWTHLAATYDGTNVVLYRNGTQVAITPAVGNMLQCTQGTRVGNRAPGPINYQFPGRIDEAAIYGSVLSADRIQTHYQAGIAAKTTTLRTITSTATVRNTTHGIRVTAELTSAGEVLIRSREELE